MTKVLAHYGIRDYRRSSTRVSAAIADATDAARLDLALGRPVLVVDTVDVDAGGKPLLTGAFALRRGADRVRGRKQLSDGATSDDRKAKSARNPVNDR